MPEPNVAALLDVYTRDELETLIARRGGVGEGPFIEALHRDLDLAIVRLEERAPQVGGDGEEKLTGALAMQLAAAGYTARCEPNVRGHVDLLVENERAKVWWLAEAKIHRSYETNIEGMLQLLTRYASGRHRHAGFLLYITQQNAQLILGRWRERLSEEERLKCVDTRDEARAVFRSLHRHPSTGYEIDVRHHGILLAYAPEA